MVGRLALGIRSILLYLVSDNAYYRQESLSPVKPSTINHLAQFAMRFYRGRGVFYSLTKHTEGASLFAGTSLTTRHVGRLTMRILLLLLLLLQ